MSNSLKEIFGYWINPEQVFCLSRAFAPGSSIEGCFIHFGEYNERKALYIHGKTTQQVADEINH